MDKPKNVPGRKRVIVGSKLIGDEIDGWPIVAFGRVWQESISNNATAVMWDFDAKDEGTFTAFVQYAYFWKDPGWLRCYENYEGFWARYYYRTNCSHLLPSIEPLEDGKINWKYLVFPDFAKIAYMFFPTDGDWCCTYGCLDEAVGDPRFIKAAACKVLWDVLDILHIIWLYKRQAMMNGFGSELG